MCHVQNLGSLVLKQYIKCREFCIHAEKEVETDGKRNLCQCSLVMHHCTGLWYVEEIKNHVCFVPMWLSLCAHALFDNFVCALVLWCCINMDASSGRAVNRKPTSSSPVKGKPSSQKSHLTRELHEQFSHLRNELSSQRSSNQHLLQEKVLQLKEVFSMDLLWISNFCPLSQPIHLIVSKFKRKLAHKVNKNKSRLPFQRAWNHLSYADNDQHINVRTTWRMYFPSIASLNFCFFLLVFLQKTLCACSSVSVLLMQINLFPTYRYRGK